LRVNVKGLGLGVHGSGHRVESSGYRVSVGFRFSVDSYWFRV
jgi:hypothetical protein